MVVVGGVTVGGGLLGVVGRPNVVVVIEGDVTDDVVETIDPLHPVTLVS